MLGMFWLAGSAAWANGLNGNPPSNPQTVMLFGRPEKCLFWTVCRCYAVPRGLGNLSLTFDRTEDHIFNIHSCKWDWTLFLEPMGTQFESQFLTQCPLYLGGHYQKKNAGSVQQLVLAVHRGQHLGPPWLPQLLPLDDQPLVPLQGDKVVHRRGSGTNAYIYMIFCNSP